MTKYNKLWPIVNGNDVVVGASAAPDDAREYLTWDEWVSLQGKGTVKFTDVKAIMGKNEREGN